MAEMKIIINGNEQKKYAITYENKISNINEERKGYAVKFYLPNNRITKYDYKENSQSTTDITVGNMFAIVPKQYSLKEVG